MSLITERLAINRQAMQENIGVSLDNAVSALWRDVDPSDAALAKWTGGITDPTNLARQIVGRATTAYFSLWAASGGQSVRIKNDPDKVMIDASSVTRWAPAPVVRLRKLISEGIDYDVAHGEAGNYAQGLAALEITWADMQAMNAIGSELGVKWRRITTGNACDFCWSVASKLYNRIDQIRVHRYCRCVVAPYHVDIDGLFRDIPRPQRKAA